MTAVRTPPEAVRSVRRGPLLTAVALIGVLVVLRTIIGWRGYFLGDDFAIRYRAASQPWSLGYAFAPYNDHVSPIGYSLEWLLQAVFPGSYSAVVLAAAVLLAVTLACCAGLMYALTARVRGMVVGVVLVGLGLFTFEVGTWWCTTVYSMTYLAFLSAALWAVVRSIRHGVSWIPALVAFAAAALSDSKGFIGVILLFGLACGVAIRPDGALGVGGALRALKGLWIGAGVVSLGMVLAVLATTSGARGEPSIGAGLRMLSDLVVLNVAPAVLGGPWWWSLLPTQEWPSPRVLPDPPAAIGLVSVAICAAGVTWLVRKRPTVSHFVPWALLYAVTAVALPIIGRSGTNLATPAYRYTFDIVLPVMLLVSLGLVPLWWQKIQAAHWSLALVGALCVSMLVSTATPAAAWGRNEGREYMARAAQGWDDLPEGTVIIPQRVPEDLVPALLWQYANTQAVMSPQPGSPAFGEVATGSLFGFSPTGEVQIHSVVGPTSVPGPDPDCGYAVTSAPRAIPLDAQLLDWEFMARVAYFSRTDTTLNLAVGGSIHTVPLPASSLTAVYFPVTGPGGDVLVSVGTQDVTVCVTEVTIGNRVSPTGEIVPFPLRRFA